MAVVELGCGSLYEVFITTRNGATLLRALPFTGIEFNRVMDDVSTATIQLGGVDGGGSCCDVVSGLVPWGYEVAVYRDSYLVWQGPVTFLSTSDDETVTIEAQDPMAWLKRRHIHNDYSWPEPGEDAAIIFNTLIADAMAPDNEPGLFGTAIPTGKRAVREYFAAELTKAYDAVQDLASGVIDYTVVARTLIAGTWQVPTDPIAYLTNQSFMVRPLIECDGFQQATVWYTGGKLSDDQGFNSVGFRGSRSDTYGVLEDSYVLSDVVTQADLNDAAQTRWDLTHRPPFRMTSGTLAPEAPLTMSLAIPGAVLDIRYDDTCFPFLDRYRLQSVQVSVTAEQDGGITEAVKIDVQALGTEVLED